jgi:hypothetical protein
MTAGCSSVGTTPSKAGEVQSSRLHGSECGVAVRGAGAGGDGCETVVRALTGRFGSESRLVEVLGSKRACGRVDEGKQRLYKGQLADVGCWLLVR